MLNIYSRSACQTYFDLYGMIGRSSSKYVFSRPRSRNMSFMNSVNLRPLAPSTTALSSVHAYVEYRNSVPTLKHFTYYVSEMG